MPRIGNSLEARASYIIQEVTRVEEGYRRCNESMSVQDKFEDALSRLRQIRSLLRHELKLIRMNQGPPGRDAVQPWLSTDL